MRESGKTLTKQERILTMKKFLMFCAAAGAILAMTGCSSLQVAKADAFNGQKIAESGTGVAHVAVSTYGLYLFSIPLITGNLDNYGMPTVLQDSSKASILARQVTLEAKKLSGKRVVDLNTSTTSAGFIFYIKAANASGNVLK